MKFYSTGSSLIMVWALFSCQPPRDLSNSGYSSLQDITGRTSMAPRAPFQCYQGYSYSDDEKVQGQWVAGADGVTFGATKDGQIGSGCGRTFTIKSNKNGQSAQFIIVDRIWENDGAGGQRYNNKPNADAKTGGIGAGYFQLDIAVGAFNALFGGSNPSEGDYVISGLNGDTSSQSSGSTGSGSTGSGATSGNNASWSQSTGTGSSTAGCSYTDASKNGGWGWNSSTGKSCPPQSGSGTSSSGAGNTGSNTGSSSASSSTTGCGYADAAKNSGWGWNSSTGQSCPPQTDSSGSSSSSWGSPASSSSSSSSGCSYADAANNSGWGWNASTGQSCPPQ